MAMTLKAARVNANLTQAKAAKILGISPDTLAKYEKAETFPNVDMLKKIEELYKVSYNDFIFLPSNNG